MHPVLREVRAHLGVDYRAPAGAPVVAVADGVVVSAAMSGGAGRMVHLRHANGFETEYLHLSVISVTAGARVRQGELIGRVGSSGLATGPHLDYRLEEERRLHQPGDGASRDAAGRTDSRRRRWPLSKPHARTAMIALSDHSCSGANPNARRAITSVLGTAGPYPTHRDGPVLRPRHWRAFSNRGAHDQFDRRMAGYGITFEPMRLWRLRKSSYMPARAAASARSRPPFGPPSPDNVFLNGWIGGVPRLRVTPAVSEVAIFLEKLLPAGGAGSGRTALHDRACAPQRRCPAV